MWKFTYTCSQLRWMVKRADIVRCDLISKGNVIAEKINMMF